MSHNSNCSSSLYRFLQQIDLDTVEAAQAVPCSHCGGKLDRADFKRKARGADFDLKEVVLRYSLCCRVDGCRKRITCASLRFMGRRVYLGFFVLFASSLPGNRQVSSIHSLSKELEVSHQTLSRWLKYWREDFPRSVFWRREQSLFTAPIVEDNFAILLTSRFAVSAYNHDPWFKLLKFLAPCFSLI